jgi:thiamine-monophosphate kinase
MPRVRDLGEFGLIRQLCRQIPRAGDDCAVLPGGLLLTCDPVVEGIHFLKTTPPRRIGWKALARNLSDIAAMAGEPTFAVVSLGLRPTTPVRWVREVYAGLHRAARQFGAEIVGGDTTHVRREQFIVVTLLGRCARPVWRTGAQVGDHVFVTGPLGNSFASGKHLTFTPRLAEARWLRQHVTLHAMIDLSDGLGSDLHHLLHPGIGFEIESARLPIHTTVRAALYDGEDFELLFTVPARDAGKLRRRFHEIGRVVRRPGVRLDGQPLPAKGYDHFA